MSDPLWITCIVVLPVFLLVFYVVRRTKPGRFRLSAKVLKLLDITIEVDSQDEPGELPLVCRIRRELRVGEPKAQVQAALAVSMNGHSSDHSGVIFPNRDQL